MSVDTEQDEQKNADRGDEVTQENAELAKDRDRDDKGRFVAKDDAKAEGAGHGEGGAAADDKQQAGAEGGDEKGDQGGEQQGEQQGDDHDDKPRGRLGARLAKLASQRDQFADQLLRANEELDRLRKGGSTSTQEKSESDKLSEQLDELYVKVETARSDGDAKLAAQLQRQIDTANRELIKLETSSIASKSSTEMLENERYNTMVEVVEATYPVLDPESEEFDPAVAQEIEFNVAAYEKAGLSASKSLERAVTLFFRENPFSKTKAKDEVPAKAAKKPTDVQRNLDAAKRAMPDVDRSAGAEGDKKLDVNNLTDEEFSKLPESKKAQLRGDHFSA